ncbi:Diacylglycerol O-acyltransferase 2 [Apostasia shenzhenica]|uniref:Acyltransferase n=1 Tax=Apostasia shenzhenica TaxID=1088818 RepID=A0A2H9ZVM8_9ASPA|nr:Diacylglycerol O-acyltransferase 2 [Apostasia shenzhenica]
MVAAAAGDVVGGEGAASAAGPAVFRGTEYSPVRSTVAVALVLGTIHLNAAIVVASLVFLPLRLAAVVFALLIFLAVIPLYSKSILGRNLSRFICKHTVGYFPVNLHVDNINDFDPNQSYVFGYEPHSMIAVGFSAFFKDSGLMPLPKIRVLGSSAAFHLPFLRHIWSWIGIVPATRKNFHRNLEAGYSCLIVPGGVREILYMDRDYEVAFLKARKGFIKIAVETGRPLVPVFCFGQSKIYKWRKFSGRLLLRIAQAVNFVPIIFWGRLGSPVPFRQPLHVVVGRPIEVKKNPQPSLDEINEVQSQFISAMEDLFERYKAEAGYPDLHLRVL